MPSQKITKAFLLLTNYVFYHMSFTSPNPPPPADEQARYEHNKSAVERRGIWFAAVIHKHGHQLVNTLELIAVLNSLYPELSSRLPPHLKTPLAPFLASKLTITRSYIIGYLLVLAGTCLRIIAYRELGRHFTFQLSIRKQHQLITHGLYAIVRHPSYTGSFMCLVGSVLYQLGPGSLFAASGMWESAIGRAGGAAYAALAAYVGVSLFRRIRAEDEMLRKEFGEQWDAWAERTPYRLCPLLY